MRFNDDLMFPWLLDRVHKNISKLRLQTRVDLQFRLFDRDSCRPVSRDALDDKRENRAYPKAHIGDRDLDVAPAAAIG